MIECERKRAFFPLFTSLGYVRLDGSSVSTDESFRACIKGPRVPNIDYTIMKREQSTYLLISKWNISTRTRPIFFAICDSKQAGRDSFEFDEFEMSRLGLIRNIKKVSKVRSSIKIFLIADD